MEKAPAAVVAAVEPEKSASAWTVKGRQKKPGVRCHGARLFLCLRKADRPSSAMKNRAEPGAQAWRNGERVCRCSR